MLEAKSQGITASVGPQIHQLVNAGMWISEEILRRILILAGE
jgi:predicted nucleic acid-binding protein